MSEVTFTVALGLLAYVYAGYPLITYARARLWPRHTRRAPIEPTVTIVLVAHNEADRIDAKMRNLLNLDYPRDRLHIVVGSDGSTDDTAARARRYERSGVRVIAFRQRRGKPSVINDLVSTARTELVLFADVRQRFGRQVVRALAAHFADPEVGAVSGELVIEPAGDTTAARGTGFYWRYEKFIRRAESLCGSTVGATGAVYAIRRSLFTPIPADTLLDDVLIPLSVARSGYRVLLEPKARAYDVACASARAEFTRKVRTIAGNFQLFAREEWLWNPLDNPVWLATVSHKALRLALPALHAGLLLSNAALAVEGGLWAACFAGQCGFYAAAAAGHVWQGRRTRPLILSVPYAMCLLCWATVVGFVRFVTQQQRVTWERTKTVNCEL